MTSMQVRASPWIEATMTEEWVGKNVGLITPREVRKVIKWLLADIICFSLFKITKIKINKTKSKLIKQKRGNFYSFFYEKVFTN